MRTPFRLAVILTVLFTVCGLARAQELAPKGSGVSVRKVEVDNGPTHTVKYFVTGGSPRLQALVRRVEWVENELSVVEQLQRLKLDTVVNERRVAAFRTAQLTNPFSPPGFLPPPIAPGIGDDGASPLQRSLQRQLAYEATPDSALQMIGLLEQLQTDLDKELKALPPQEKKAAEGPVDALRPRVAALTGRDVPPPPSQPVASTGPAAAPRVVQAPAQAVPQQRPTPPAPAAFQQAAPQNPVSVIQETMRMQQQILQVQRQIFQHYPQLAAGPRQ
jgi:hypothetical protein